MPSYKTEAVILNRFNLGETDKILTIFTKKYGKIKVVAKGVRKITSRKGGKLELFNQVKLLLAKGKNIDIIMEVELVESFPKWRKNLTRVGVAYYLAELIEGLSAEGQQEDKVYRLLIQAFFDLGDSNLIKLIRQFEENVLVELGFGIPDNRRLRSGSYAGYIEEILERRIKSKQVLKKIKYG